MSHVVRQLFLGSRPRVASVTTTGSIRLAFGTLLPTVIAVVPGLRQPACFRRNFSAAAPFMSLQNGGSSASRGESNARDVSNKDQRKEEAEVVAAKKERERPWHREGADRTVADQAEEQDDGSSRGKLLTTPTRLLKLILPLPRRLDLANQEKPADQDLEPLALLVHPHQPLSYIERLLQAELPPLRDKNGREKMPDIHFRAEDAAHGDNALQSTSSSSSDQKGAGGANGDQNVASYSGLGHLGPRKKDTRWVRWSSSTEVGDFIRDAARGREFAIEIEGYGTPRDQADLNVGEVRIAVPSFSDRTHYMRQRLRIMSRRINATSQLKNKCDEAAHRGAHRLAKGGFVGLASWTGLCYYVSFHTELGWDLVEPASYLVSLVMIMLGYLYFLYVSRDLSYRAALNLTVSKRQHALYKEHGFNIERWEQAVHEANSLRREIKMVADEYDVEWDETKDLGGSDVKEVLENEQDEYNREKEREKRSDENEKELARRKEEHQKHQQNNQAR